MSKIAYKGTNRHRGRYAILPCLTLIINDEDFAFHFDWLSYHAWIGFNRKKK